MRSAWFVRTLSFRLFLCLAASAQSPATANTASPNSFAAEPYLVKEASTVVSINADGTGTRVLTYSAILRSEAALRQAGVVSASFASHSEHADFVYVRTTHADGAVEETPVSSAIEQPAAVTQQAPLYSDVKVKQVPVRSLRLGDTLEWQIRFTIDHPEVANQAWGQDTFIKEFVTLNETYELRVPATLHITTWTNPVADAEVSDSTQNGVRIYRWHHANLRPTVGPEADAFRKAEEKRIRTADEEIDFMKGTLPSFAWTTFASWQAVGEWYHSLASDRVAPDAPIKAKVAELTAGKSTQREKAQAVYTYVSTQVRYIGVDFGIGRYQPHTAAEVFANQYGDCKDKHTLLASMLSVLGIRADAVLVGAGVRFNSPVPSPSAFNHLITRIDLDGKPVWLDATAEVGAWGALLFPIRDQQALVVPVSGAPVILQTPADLPFPQVTAASVTGSLDDGLTSDSTFTLTFHSDNELYLRAILHSVSPAQYGQFVQGFMANMGFGGTTSDPAIEHLDDPAQPLTVSFHYHRVKEKDWGENRVTAAFMAIGLPAYSEQTPPNSSIQLGPPRTETSSLELKLPKNWTVQLPKEIHAHKPFATIDVTYHQKDQTLFAERKLTVLQSKVSVAEAQQYRSWYDEGEAGSYPYIQLLPPPKDVTIATADTPRPPVKPVTPEQAAVPDNPEAVDLIAKGFDAIRNMDLDTARKSFDQANAINPTQRGLWLGYAAISEMLGKPTETTSNMAHELTYHPEEVQLYRPLAQAQLHAADSAGALATLHAWVKAEPDSPEPYLELAQRLHSLKRYQDALQVSQDAIKHLEHAQADLTDLLLASANAQVALGHTREAVDGISGLTSGINDRQTNDLNYILAQSSAHLDRASQTQTVMLDHLEEGTAGWGVHDPLKPIYEKENELAADWDTMGWILYREGKYTDALAYIEAAARVLDREEVHQHLSALATALHRPALDQANLKLRTIPLGPANGRHGVASFTLLLADGKVLDSVPTHEQSASSITLDHPEDLLKGADLHGLFPPSSKAHLVRSGFLNCHPNTCELVLSPLP